MTITINRQMSSDDALAPPKTKRSLRTIPIDDTTVDCFNIWRASQAETRQRVGRRWHDQDLVVTTRYGSPINGAITFQIDASHEAWQVANWAGTSARMIEDVYRHRILPVSQVKPVELAR